MNNTKSSELIRFCSSLLAVLAAFGALPKALAGLERNMALKSEATVTSNAVCLDQITDSDWIKNRCRIDRKNCCRWTLQNGANSSEFKRADLQRELDRTNFGGIRVILDANADSKNDSVIVTQTHREVSSDEIRAILKKEITERYSNAEFKNLTLPAPIYISLTSPARTEAAVSFDLPETLSAKNHVRILDMTTKEVLGVVDFTVDQKVDAFVAKKTVRPMETITMESFERKRIDIPAGSQDHIYFDKENFPIGVRAKYTIRPGQPLSSASIERTPIVKLGDVVTLILKSDNLKISTKGVVQSSAGIGDTVTVQLPRYNRSFRGKLQESKTVEVWF